ncbi:hypothetical protein C943_03684 [Mariniradius saccharolyticus AK6]|uniref:Uncharacterized protein n=1 Tax=Mariniradius saccharolyticus AK6 TaxID=1239962 RepID=M7XAL5_9BACT|nr:hypothetical protein C943_03684 [Mariniradius saccharolyticus AK6]
MCLKCREMYELKAVVTTCQVIVRRSYERLDGHWNRHRVD